MNIFADVFGVPASRNVGSSGASLGSAICAAVATGVYPDFATAAGAMQSQRETFAPNLENYEVYRRMNEKVYCAIHTATDPILEQSFSIFH
jgi:sugar (pentulose or hexulose) kinase